MRSEYFVNMCKKLKLWIKSLFFEYCLQVENCIFSAFKDTRFVRVGWCVDVGKRGWLGDQSLQVFKKELWHSMHMCHVFYMFAVWETKCKCNNVFPHLFLKGREYELAKRRCDIRLFKWLRHYD